MSETFLNELISELKQIRALLARYVDHVAPEEGEPVRREGWAISSAGPAWLRKMDVVPWPDSPPGSEEKILDDDES